MFGSTLLLLEVPSVLTYGQALLLCGVLLLANVLVYGYGVYRLINKDK